MTNFLFLDSINFIKVRATFEALEQIILPQYKGSAYRGCLGESLKAKVCRQRHVECMACTDRFDCPFSRLYNSPVAKDHLHHEKYSKSPHPYLIELIADTRTHFIPGDTFGFDLILIGSAIELLSEVLPVFNKMGERGIGQGRGRFKPVELKFQNPHGNYLPLQWFGNPEQISLAQLTVPEVNAHISLQFENPIRFLKDNHLLTTPPTFGFFVARLAQRLALLAHFHGGAPLIEIEKGLMTVLSTVNIRESELKMVDWRRYSGTQDAKMNFDGQVGTITYEGEGLQQWIPLLLLGSWLHTGSTTTFGLGKYSLESTTA